ncbi:reverse transcriptase domain-containing protein [Streptomyces sp. NBC_00846]|uniref:reverse transcriptase/maturase family protein n=1 Tax=Streptomyces sp. NBC_00846 TaxID=2975849 RepID=UPI00386EB70B|nr:reverse transcriptase domain-containing protein [Streptomyces sp. NBC_00846]
MQSAETVLSVIRERGRRGLPLERPYRQLFNRELFLVAYGRIYSNDGAMTPGVTGETVDGMSLDKIDSIISALRSESYRWTPARRVYIDKKGTKKKRPLGMPTWSDKIVAEVVRLLLEAYYDVRFSDRSHGFRPGRGCHTALDEVARTWTGTHWFVEGDIADCFGSLDHQVMLAILTEKIHDGRFLQLIERMLKAGYLEDWRWKATLSGAPQGGIASPILSNIYLDRLDRFVEQQLIPEYTRGGLRRRTPAYARVQYQIAVGKRLGDREAVSALRRQLRQLPSGDPNDPAYRRLKYVRYCDDFLLGFAGPKREAEEIKVRIQSFLREELRLELSQSKTLITHAASQAARFLGYEIKVQHADTKVTSGKRSANGRVGLFVPGTVIRNRCTSYTRKGEPTHRGLLVHDQDYTIVARYGAEYRGFIQYYLLAQNVHRLGRLRRVMEVSLLKTLAAKHKSTVNKMARKYKTVVETPDGPRTCCEAVVQRDNGRKPLVARFGGIPLKRKRTAIIADIKPTMAVTKRNELIHRLLAGQCEMCEGLEGLQVHHVRKLADLNRPGQSERPVWVRMMAMRKRKTLVLCERCHQGIHAGRATVTTRK